MASKSLNPKAVIAVAAFAAFLATFNETYLNVAFAPIMTDLSVDVQTVQWLATGYMLGAAVMVPISAFAYRSINTRLLFVLTTGLLVVGSIVGALADSFAMLLVGRIVQSLETGMLIPINMSITLDTAPREKLGTYMGIMGAMTTLGPSLSVIVAGVLLSVFEWHMLLWVFAALSLLCLAAGAVLLGDVAKLTHPKLDAASVALVGLALVGILYGVSSAFTGDKVVAVACIAVGAVLLAGFVKRQGSLEYPLINLEPLKIPAYTVGVIINMLSLVTIFAMNILVPTFMQSVLQTPAIVASLALFPAILASCFVSPLAGRIYDKHGAGILLPCGFVCIAVFSVTVSALIATGNVVLLAICYIPVICGSALIIGPVQSFALSKLAPELNPHGVTVMSTGFQIAGCVGSSVFTGVYAAIIAHQSASGAGVAAASATGMLAAGTLVGVFAAVGFCLAMWVRGQEKRAVAPAQSLQVKEAVATAGVSLKDSVLRSIMKTDVYTVAEDEPVLNALKLFVEKGISGVPVVDAAGRATGFLSDGDIMGYLANQTPAFKSAYSFIVEQENEDFDSTLKHLMELPVGKLATKSLVSVDINDDMGEICKTLAEHHLKKAPVLENGKMVGVINRSNISRYSINSYLQSIEAAS